jgi:hypothetical protein
MACTLARDTTCDGCAYNVSESHVRVPHHFFARAARATCLYCISQLLGLHVPRAKAACPSLSGVHAPPIRLHVPFVRSARTTCQGPTHHVSVLHVLLVRVASNICQGFTHYVSWLLAPRNRAPSITCEAPTRVRAARTLCHGCFAASTSSQGPTQHVSGLHVPRAINI